MENNKRNIIINELNLGNVQGTLSEKKPVVEVKGLDVNFTRGSKLFEAVKKANLNIYENDIIGVVGESGSGKTTLGRSILGLWDHASGEVRINGRQVPTKRITSVNKKNIWVYKNGQMIFQDSTSSLDKMSKVLKIVNEGLKNFNYIKNESKEKISTYKKELFEIDENIKILKNPKYAKLKFNEEFVKNETIKLLETSNKKEYLKLLDDYSEFVQISVNANKFKRRKHWLEQEIKNSIKNIKKKIKSDKALLKEEAQVDKEFIKNAEKEERIEYKKLKSKHKKNPTVIESNINKRINSFIKYNIKKSSTISLPIKNEISFALVETNSAEKIKEIISKLEYWIESYDGQEEDCLNAIKNITLGWKISLLKIENIISPFNTRGFDFIYKFIDDKIVERINYNLRLIKDLNFRLDNEKTKLINANDDDRVYQMQNIYYLNEYKRILKSIIEEDRLFRIEYKNILSSHSEKGIGYFYSEIKKINARNNLLKLSLVTWKGTQRLKYEKRRNKKLIKDLEEQKEKEISRIKNLNKQYGNKSLSKIVNFIFKKELKSINLKTNSKAIEKKKEINLDKIDKLIVKRNEIIEKIKFENKILKNRKFRKKYTIERIKETLRLVGLSDDSINKYPSQFSGGQKQRIGIARTIITKPKFIIADEPISALDVSVQAQVINLLKDLHEKIGLTMMFIAHDLQMVHYISNKIVVIYRGNIVEYGTADEVYKNPIHPYTKTLIAAMPSLKEVGKQLNVSEYKWTDHQYNEFSEVALQEINKDHFVYGTKEEINKWTNN